MKIAIYSPYLDTAGGGEKYILTIAEYLSGEEEVDILLDDHLWKIGAGEIKRKIEKLHGIDLAKANFVKSPIGKGGGFLERLLFLRRYDFLFYLTDGSIFFSTAKNSVVHFQVPFTKLPGLEVWTKLKLSSWKEAIYNSKFTKSYVEKNWGIKGKVIYPPVSVNLFRSLRKKKQILSVGRFFGFLKDEQSSSSSKKHEFLVKAFKEFIAEHGLHDWSLHLAGGATKGDEKYLDHLKNISAGYKIFLYPNVDIEKLKKLYGESMIYWHASGFGEDDPKKFEHFGITCVEAMAAGAIPIVINKGGLTEIVEDGKSGYLWDSTDQLKDQTLEVIKNGRLRKKMVEEGQRKALDFSKETFIAKINELVYG